MSSVEVTKTPLEGLLILKPRIFSDNRGFFYESFRANDYKALGIAPDLVQDNSSVSHKNVLRGLHIQKDQGQILWPVYGHVMQVTLDVRPDSLTFGQHFSIELKHTEPTQIYMPPGFAGGFYVLSDTVCMNYKCSQYYTPSDEAGVLWSDPDLGIDWPSATPEVSARDQAFPPLKDLKLDAA